jgi:hypothetical protein
MRRAQLLGHVLLGYYVLPAAAADPIEAVLCPPGAMRHERRVWNKGDNRLKFIVLQVRDAARLEHSSQSDHASSMMLCGEVWNTGDSRLKFKGSCR